MGGADVAFARGSEAADAMASRKIEEEAECDVLSTRGSERELVGHRRLGLITTEPVPQTLLLTVEMLEIRAARTIERISDARRQSKKMLFAALHMASSWKRGIDIEDG